MYARRQTRAKPRQAEPLKFAAPTAGWVANRNLSEPGSIEGPGAAILDNFFPKSSSVVLRRGRQLYATLGDGSLPVRSIFSYANGLNKRMFGATEARVYDITAVVFPEVQEITTEDDDLIVTEDGDYIGFESDAVGQYGVYTGGEWINVQFATSGGVYLIGVNGQDDGFVFDGNEFYPNIEGGIIGLAYDAETAPFTEGSILTGGVSAATGTIVRAIDNGSAGTLWLRDVVGTFSDNEAITDADGGSATANGPSALYAPGTTFGSSGLTTADMAFVWVYKNRLWYAQKDSMTAWYLEDVDAIAGNALPYPLAGVFTRGGSLTFGAAWSLEGGAEGGLSEQMIFVSTEGEVAVFQGTNPSGAATWAKVGLYRVGTPLGPRAFLRGGGDIAIATSVGLVPLSKAIQLDVTSLNVATVSYKIADAWSDAVSQRGLEGWQCEVWPEQKMALISPPDLIGSSDPVIFVSNTETGAWARYTGWYALCMEVFKGLLFFGSSDGRVYLANVSGQDDTSAYTGAVLPLFDDRGSFSSLKIGTVGRAIVRANGTVNDQIAMHADFDLSLQGIPDASPIEATNLWGNGIWGTSKWGETRPTVISQEWRSLGGSGYACSLSCQITSGALAPLDAEIVRLEMLYTTAEVMT